MYADFAYHVTRSQTSLLDVRHLHMSNALALFNVVDRNCALSASHSPNVS